MTKDAFRYFVVLVFTATAAGIIYYEFQLTRPCKAPIHYAIGEVDSRFGISLPAILTEAKAAATIWNKAGGKTLLTYDSEADLKINFIYDEREASAKLGAQIATEQDALDAQKSSLDMLEAQYQAQKTAYNQKVATINARGGATVSEQRELAAERQGLEAFGVSLQNQVVSYNERVKTINARIAEFNKTAGRTFEEGEYIRSRQGEKINIYEFVGKTQLERVLAHEFGHAIGLDHNDNEKSIMYAKNESGNLVPTPDDLAALKAVCRL